MACAWIDKHTPRKTNKTERQKNNRKTALQKCRAGTGETLQPRTQTGYGVLVCLRRKQPNTLRLTSRAFRGINRRCRYTFIAEQRKRKSPNRTLFQVFDLGFHWRATRDPFVAVEYRYTSVICAERAESSITESHLIRFAPMSQTSESRGFSPS